MMVCGSIVSSEALAGATSVLKLVPVTITVSIFPVRVSFAASCCAEAEVAPMAASASQADDIRRRLVVFTDMEFPCEKSMQRGANQR